MAQQRNDRAILKLLVYPSSCRSQQGLAKPFKAMFSWMFKSFAPDRGKGRPRTRFGWQSSGKRKRPCVPACATTVLCVAQNRKRRKAAWEFKGAEDVDGNCNTRQLPRRAPNYEVDKEGASHKHRSYFVTRQQHAHEDRDRRREQRMDGWDLIS